MENRKKLNTQIDMLQGNINRMCVTNDDTELIDMQQWAKKRIDEIYMLNRQRLRARPSLVDSDQELTQAIIRNDEQEEHSQCGN